MFPGITAPPAKGVPGLTSVVGTIVGPAAPSAARPLGVAWGTSPKTVPAALAAF
jgi:hypothetical protein